MDVIKIEDLEKSFGEIKAVQGISFRVKEGELFAFLGVNGAGKSTTISILSGQLTKDGGRVEINGKNLEDEPEAVKRAIGVVFQNSTLDKPLSVYDNLKSRAALYHITGAAFEKRLEELCVLLQFKELLPRTFGKLSGGQKRRIDIARALLHQPKILILDEPTTGLDPQTRQNVWQVIESLRKDKSTTVFLTTHYMEEAADADYVVILDGGKIAAQGTPHSLKREYTADFLTLYNVEEKAVAAFGYPYKKVGAGYRIQLPNTATATALIEKYPQLFIDYEIVKGKMDDVFLAATGKKLSGEEQ